MQKKIQTQQIINNQPLKSFSDFCQYSQIKTSDYSNHSFNYSGQLISTNVFHGNGKLQNNSKQIFQGEYKYGFKNKGKFTTYNQIDQLSNSFNGYFLNDEPFFGYTESMNSQFTSQIGIFQNNKLMHGYQINEVNKVHIKSNNLVQQNQSEQDRYMHKLKEDIENYNNYKMLKQQKGNTNKKKQIFVSFKNYLTEYFYSEKHSILIEKIKYGRLEMFEKYKYLIFPCQQGILLYYSETNKLKTLSLKPQNRSLKQMFIKFSQNNNVNINQIQLQAPKTHASQQTKYLLYYLLKHMILKIMLEKNLNKMRCSVQDVIKFKSEMRAVIIFNRNCLEQKQQNRLQY